MVDTWQPSKGVLFFYLKYKGGEATRERRGRKRFLVGRRGSYFFLGEE